MGKMFEHYRRLFGERVKGGEYASQLNGPCPFCGEGEDRFTLRAESTETLGELCEKYGFKEFYWCRKCLKGGDVISFLQEVVGMTFAEACEELGITAPTHERRERRAPKEKLEEKPFEGRKFETPREQWEDHARRMAEDAAKVLPLRHGAVKWLAKRGITLRMAERYGLGFLDGDGPGKACRYRPRSSFGLPVKQVEGDSRKGRMLWIPRGVTIPSYGPDGKVGMFRLRRPNGDLKETVKPNGKVKKDEKYWELTGGTKESYHLPPTVRQSVTVYLIVEAELDAVLLHATAGESVGCVALRNATNKPDARTHEALARADLILLCLDDDEAGENGDKWWLKTYPQARVAKVPGAKDAGEAFEKGIDLRAWLEKALPMSVRLAESTREAVSAFTPPAPRNDGPLGHASTVPGALEDGTRTCGADAGKKENGGAGEEPCASSSASAKGVFQDDFSDLLTQDVMKGLRAALPSYLAIDAVPREVLALSVMWRGAPIRYVKQAGGGFEWRVQAKWGLRNNGLYQRFMRVATSSTPVWEWLDAHVDAEIDSRNFLNLFGAA